MKSKFYKLSILHAPYSAPLGFTLVEIVIVIALIGILGTWMISLVDPAAQFRKGRDAERKAELAQLQAALELYRADKGEYPPAPLPDCNSPLQDGSVVYIQKIPCDPDQSSYFYSRPSASTYALVACLENLHDVKLDQTNDSSCAADRWSYTVANL